RPAARAEGDKWLHDKAPTGPAKGTAAQIVPRPVPTSSVNAKIVVSNLHYEITPKDLAAIFGQIGTLVREPLIRYDRSGRSSGVAIISFETPAEATRAKKQFDGILAKGQPMSIAFDTLPPPGPARRSASAPQSLLNRIQKPPLLDRLSRDDISTKASPASYVLLLVGPMRSRPRGPKPRREPKKVKTAEELDMELDAFMGDSEPTAQNNPSAAAGVANKEDVDMS
ncbi:hypothetical protein M378DRAFT_80844, partial [Amanita muscaria Koide BX008]